MRPPKCVSPHRFPPRQRWAPAIILGLLLIASLGLERLVAQVDHDRDPEPMVSLSAATISEILRREPGLLLEVKRLLVRKAYEQGRLLDPADLTDDALFRLLREDDNIRVLATREIERREYIRPKPTRQEIEKDQIARLHTPESSKSPGSGAVPVRQSDEEKYWTEHEQPGPQLGTRVPRSLR